MCLGRLADALTAATLDSAVPESLEAELKTLYEDHALALIRFATSFGGDADASRDAVQDGFIRYLELRRGGTVVIQPKAWLASVIRNRLIDKNRRDRRYVDPDTARREHKRSRLKAVATSTQDDVETKLLWARVKNQVSRQEFACLKLRAEGFSYAEIAEALKIQSGTVSMYLTRSREKLSRTLREGAV